MLRQALIAATLPLLLLLADPAVAACQQDTDCAMGSQCLRQAGATYGRCVAGRSPRASRERGVLDDLSAPSRTGNTGSGAKECRFDSACGTGQQCIKHRGSRKGYCAKGN